MGQIKIIENTSEIGAGTRGASLGVGALKVAAQNQGSDFFGRFERFEMETDNDLLNETSSFDYAKQIDGMLRTYQRTVDVVSHVLANGDFPLVLSGDHASAGGTIAGIKNQYPDKKLGVIWVDAHADLHTPYTTPSGNLHGMPLATALGTDNIECKINDPMAKTVDHWNQLKEMGGTAPKISAEDLVFIAVRDTEIPEDDLIAREGIKNYSVDELRQKGIEAMCDEIKDKLQSCDIVYISFDVDSLDCILVSKGTGTPVENGLTPEEGLQIMGQLCDWEKVISVEVVEINPCLDEKINTMAETAYTILKHFTKQIEKRL